MSPFRANLAILALSLAAFKVAAAPDISSFVKDLDSDDLLVRESATDSLRALGPSNLKNIFEAMKQKPLSLEQKTRMKAAAWPLFETSPRAGLGISFDPMSDEGSVRIGGTVEGPGFHAHEFLKPGDIVRELDSFPVRTQAQARHVILSHDPGDIIDCLVIRQGTPIRAAIRLGNFNDLDSNRGQFRNGIVGREPKDISSAFEVRVLRELGSQAAQSGAPAIDAGLGSDAWDVLYRKLQVQRNRRVERDGRVNQANIPALVAGGPARADINDVTRPNVRRLDAGFLEGPNILEQIAQCKSLMQNMQNRADDIKLRLAQPNVKAQERQILKEQLITTQAVMTDLQMRIEKLSKELNGR